MRLAHFNRSVLKSIENPWKMQGAVTPIDAVVSALTGITMWSQGHEGFDGRFRLRVTAFSVLRRLINSSNIHKIIQPVTAYGHRVTGRFRVRSQGHRVFSPGTNCNPGRSHYYRVNESDCALKWG